MKVGDRLFKIGINNMARPGSINELIEVEVSKVGRKYFSVKKVGESYEIDFHKDNWRQKTYYSPNYKLYSSRQEWLDEKLEKTICSHISEAFQYGRNTKLVPLEALKQIAFLIDGSEF